MYSIVPSIVAFDYEKPVHVNFGTRLGPARAQAVAAIKPKLAHDDRALAASYTLAFDMWWAEKDRRHKMAHVHRHDAFDRHSLLVKTKQKERGVAEQLVEQQRQDRDVAYKKKWQS